MKLRNYDQITEEEYEFLFRNEDSCRENREKYSINNKIKLFIYAFIGLLVNILLIKFKSIGL